MVSEWDFINTPQSRKTQANIITCRKWQESRIFLKAAILVQEVLRVEGPRRLPHFVIFQHRVQ